MAKHLLTINDNDKLLINLFPSQPVDGYEEGTKVTINVCYNKDKRTGTVSGIEVIDRAVYEVIMDSAKTIDITKEGATSSSNNSSPSPSPIPSNDFDKLEQNPDITIRGTIPSTSTVGTPIDLEFPYDSAKLPGMFTIEWRQFPEGTSVHVDGNASLNPDQTKIITSSFIPDKAGTFYAVLCDDYNGILVGMTTKVEVT